MSLEVCVLASGSRGNSALVKTDSTAILIDAGLSGKKIFALLDEVGFNYLNLAGIVVTHDHHDHISAVGVIARKLGIPVYATIDTYKSGQIKLKKLPQIIEIYSGRPFTIGNIQLMPFPTFHDADGAIALVIKSGNQRLGVLTDIGHFHNLAFERLSGCTTLILEANYCPKMLMNGNYPWSTKQRILGRQGHLSNFDTCNIITKLFSRGLKRVFLSHLSENNNCPEVVRKTLVETLPAVIMQETEFFMTFQEKPTKIVAV
jgi:phosphoribosyl 1,2-cyclic phosphodiesterase